MTVTDRILLLSAIWTVGSGTSSPCFDHDVIPTTRAMMASLRSKPLKRQNSVHVVNRRPPEVDRETQDPRRRYEYHRSRWFRLQGEGGTEILNHRPSSWVSCGTGHPGWIEARLPKRNGQTLETTLCHVDIRHPSTCHMTVGISVRNCNDFFVYKFPDVDSNLQYRVLGEDPLFCTQVPQPLPCSDYDVLETTQAMMVTPGTRVLKLRKRVETVDRNQEDPPPDPRRRYEFNVSRWFRLEGEGGTEILNHRPSNSGNICGTSHPGWIDGMSPTREGQTLDTTVCHLDSSRSSICLLTARISIQKCSNFFIYKFLDIGYNLQHRPYTDDPLFCTQNAQPSPCSEYAVLETTREMMVTPGIRALKAKKTNVVNRIEEGSEVSCIHSSHNGRRKGHCGRPFYRGGKIPYVRGELVVAAQDDQKVSITDLYKLGLLIPQWKQYEYHLIRWFRLQGEGGTEVLNQEPSNVNICGTRYPGWINGRLPSQAEQNTETRLCHMTATESPCDVSVRVFVQKCIDFFVYRFPDGTGAGRAQNTPDPEHSLFCTQEPGTGQPGTEGTVNPEPEETEVPVACNSNPCLNHGTCYNILSGYECICVGGFTGPRCETNIDECASLPCLYGGTCVDEVNSYRCVCPQGLTGKKCEKNTDDCGTHRCQNGGKCVDSVNGYYCFCALGFSGPRCETNENNCGRSNPCRNGGTCRDGVNSYSCECASGFEGENCEERISRCRSGPCRNGGTCTDRRDSYRCSCPAGYSGNNCGTKFTHCDSSPCKNGGKCVSSEDSFTCTCLPGWSGHRCQDKNEFQGFVDDIENVVDETGDFSMDNLYEKVENALNDLADQGANDEDSLSDKLGEKIEKSVKNFLGKKFGKRWNKLKPKITKRRCANFNLGSAANNFKRAYQNCLKNRQKKCQEQGRKEREQNGEEEEGEEETQEEAEEEEEEEQERAEEDEEEEESKSCNDKCPAVENISHGRYVGSSFDCGHSVIFTCDDGYEMTGCETAECKITCEKGGRWSSEPPACERKTCGGFITLSSTNPQTTLTIPDQVQGESTVDCTWVVITSEQNELNIDFPRTFTSRTLNQNECHDHYVEIGSGPEIARFCRTTSTYQRSFSAMVVIRVHSMHGSQVTFEARVSIVKDYFEKPGLNLERNKRAGTTKKTKLTCEVQVNDKNKWPTEAPIMMTTTNEAMFPDGKNKLIFTDDFKASCTTKKFRMLPDAPFLTVKCGGGDKVEASYKIFKKPGSRPGFWQQTKQSLTFPDLDCDGVPGPYIMKPTSTSHKFVWEIDGGTVPVIEEIEFNPVTKIPRYSKHKLHGSTLKQHEADSHRPSFKRTPNITSQMDPDIYPMAAQRNMLKSIDASLETKIDCCVNNHFVHGHLVPNADFYYKAWRHATFYMTNVAPQWQAINAGNWLVVENAVRKYAESRKQDVKITTGTHGVLNIDGHNINLPGPAGTPVPSHFWKVLHDPMASKAVAFVIVNNPYATSDPVSPGLPIAADKMCFTQCPLLQGLPNNPTPGKGLLMCCSLSDLRGNIADVPNIPGTADLFVSPELRAALEKVK